MSELKPCPFCGDIPTKWVNRNQLSGNGTIYIECCVTMEIHFILDEHKPKKIDSYKHNDKVIDKAWNTRIPQWQPIETINNEKKDRYYLFGGYDVYGNWVSNKFHFSLDGFINGWCMLTVKNNGITHWMPLPTPPKEKP